MEDQHIEFAENVYDPFIPLQENVQQNSQLSNELINGPFGPMLPEGTFGYNTRHLSYSLVHKSKSNLNGTLCGIYNDIISLTDMIRDENLTQFEVNTHLSFLQTIFMFQNFDNRLLTALKAANARTPHKWLQQAFHDLMLKLGENRSWRAYANIINSIFLVIDVANKFNQEGRSSQIDIIRLQHSIVIDLEEYLMNHYREFIIESHGGYKDISHYYKYVKNRSRGHLNLDLSSVWPTFLIPALGAIGLYIFSSRK